jgi:prepilin-type N-terminal cleavage/methylation domain-containing protein
MKAFQFLKKNKKNKKEGFSIIEFIVVMSIFAIMSGVSLFNYNDYRNKIEEMNIAQDIALSVRQAQLYGISASNRDVGQSFSDAQDETDFFSTSVVDITNNTSIRGVAFDVQNKKITLFEDINQNNVYNSGTDRVLDERQVLSSRVLLKSCLSDIGVPSNFATCPLVDSSSNIISVTFQRPYPDAYIVYEGDFYTHLRIGIFRNEDDVEPSSYILIDPSGHVSVVRI